MKKKGLRFLSFVFAMAGLTLLLSTIYPILSFDVSDTGDFEHYLSPIPEEEYVGESIDYTDPNNWFEELTSNFDKPNKIDYYNVTIPSLNIEDAVVTIGGEDLEDSLIQYPGTALPGKKGNAVIFGHSILPQFYDPDDYLAIFSTLPTIDEGESIEVHYDGASYKYIVEEMFEVLPTDLEILSQNSSNSHLTLVTCTPPGHPLRPKRLIVRARLVPFDKISLK